MIEVIQYTDVAKNDWLRPKIKPWIILPMSVAKIIENTAIIQCCIKPVYFKTNANTAKKINIL